MTEQQAPTLQILTALRQALINAEVPGAYQHAIVDEFRLLAKNIDTASPSPASLDERMRAALVELFHAEWSPGGSRYVEAQTAALRLGEELATPQPSPTGPVEAKPRVWPHEATPAMRGAYSKVILAGSELDGAMVWRAMYAASPASADETAAPTGPETLFAWRSFAEQALDVARDLEAPEKKTVKDTARALLRACDALDRAPTGPREGEPPTLICPRCKVDRFAQACPAPGLECGLIGTTQGAPETATPSLPERSSADWRRLTGLWRYGVAVLPPTAPDFYNWLGILDAAIDERTSRPAPDRL